MVSDAITLTTFETAMIAAVDVVDNHLIDRQSTAEIYVTLVAVTQGDWTRIHPFASRNGRTARLWTHWLAARYDLPPLVRIKPDCDGLDVARFPTLPRCRSERRIQLNA